MTSERFGDARKATFLERLDPLGALRSLSPQHRDQLAEFVFDISQLIEVTPSRALLREYRKSPQQVRMLNRKAAKVRAAFRDLADYWRSIGGGPYAEDEPEDEAARGNVYLVDDLEFDPGVTGLLEDVGEAVQLLKSLPVSYGPIRKAEKAPRVKAIVALALNDLFVNECHCSVREAEIRIGKIGNHLWNWGVAVRERAESDEKWRGCEAVRKLLKRYGRQRDAAQGTRVK